MKSLRARLTAAVMMPLLALAITFGGTTCWMIHRTISTASDRLLVGSVLTISRAIEAERATHESLLTLAVELLRTRSAPLPVYSVFDGDRLVTGTPDLLPPEDYLVRPAATLPLHDPAGFPQDYRDRRLATGYIDDRDSTGVIQPTYLRDAMLGGRPVRVATEIRQFPGSERPVAIQVADFIDDRRAYEQTYYLRVLGAGILVVMIAVLLFYGAVTWGLGPFASLTQQIEEAHKRATPNVRVALSPGDPLEARSLASAFNDLMARNERAVQSLRQFTANASHQLRTPLAIVRVHVDVLGRYGSSTPQGATALADIAAAVESLERLLAQLITLARMDEQSSAETPLNAFDLTGLVAEILATRVTHPDTARMDIGFEAQEAGLAALGDPMLATEMIGNLVDNAIRYNRADGSVTVRVLQSDGMPVVEIEDDGPGIAPADREKVWERFYRAPGVDAPSGSGLGLPIVRALGERMGAHVFLTSGRDGRGTLAVIEFQPATRHANEEIETNFDPTEEMTAC